MNDCPIKREDLPEPYTGPIEMHQTVFYPSGNTTTRGSIVQMPWVGSGWHNEMRAQGHIYLNPQDALKRAFYEAWIYYGIR